MQHLRTKGYVATDGQHLITNYFSSNNKQSQLNISSASSITSQTFAQFLANEGRDIYNVNYEFKEEQYQVFCISCNCFMDDGRSSFQSGFSLNGSELMDENVFKQWKHRIIAHNKSSMHSQSISMLHNKYNNKVPLFIKMQTAHFIIIHCEPRVIFEKLMYLFSNIKKTMNKYTNIDAKALDVGDKCHSWKESERIFEIFVKIVFKRMQFVISANLNQSDTSHFVFHSLTIDGWSKGMFL